MIIGFDPQLYISPFDRCKSSQTKLFGAEVALSVAQ